MATNNFKQLGKEEEERFAEAPPGTELGIMGNIRMFGFVSDVIELYLPKIFEVFITLIGGGSEPQTKTQENNIIDSQDEEV